MVPHEIGEHDLGVAQHRAVIRHADEHVGAALEMPFELVRFLLLVIERELQCRLELHHLHRLVRLVLRANHLHRILEVHAEQAVAPTHVRGHRQRAHIVQALQLHRREVAAHDVGPAPHFSGLQIQRVDVEDAVGLRIRGVVDLLAVQREGRLQVAVLAEGELRLQARVVQIHKEDLLVLVDAPVVEHGTSIHRPARVGVEELVLRHVGQVAALQVEPEDVHDAALVRGEQQLLAVGRKRR